MTISPSASYDDIDLSISPRSDTRSGNIKVAVRLCPIFEGTKGSRKRALTNNDNSKAWGIEFGQQTSSLIQKGRPYVFHFDRVFDEATETSSVYQGLAKPMVSSVLNGKHATIFAYGQTGSGKTYTMQGGDTVENGQAGIIQLVASDLFRSIQYDVQRKYQVKVSYFEIYNEQIRDLLTDDGDNSSKNDSSSHRRDRITVRTNERGEVVVNVRQREVHSVDEALEILFQGNVHRTVAATDMNAHSSRSHSIFRLTVESRSAGDEGQIFDSASAGRVRVSDLNLVDLAGSESLKTTKTTGIRQREGATINKSLLALTSVIQALSQPANKKPQHINYRDSKLTRILQPHLSGNAEMAILCCASRAKNFVEETRSTLKFASRAKLVQMKAEINEVIDDGAIIRNLQKQLLEVRKQLELAEQKLEEEKARKPIVVKPTSYDEKATLSSSAHSDIMVEKEMDEYAANLGAARKSVERYQKDRGDSFDPNEFMNSSQCSTANLSSEYDKSNEKESHLPPSIEEIVGESDPKSESCASLVSSSDDDSFHDPEEETPDISLNICSQISHPETIRGTPGADPREKSVFRPQVSDTLCPNGRLEKELSCDDTALSTKSAAQSGNPLQAIESLKDRKCLLPDEITIIDTALVTGNNMCLMDQLKDSEARIRFLEEKLEMSDNIIEANFRDLKRARFCIRDLVQRNVEMNGALNRKGREDARRNYEMGEIMIEQYWILKASIYSSVFFFLSGSHEYFLATAFFVWLALETSLSA
eukprot:CAMPEP_0116151660 /NCGR_PEP_ID=MMETSP0329-20121206/20221_1 /TAXON_ID=697910 /ORGANISM="Pseudo-nitzschia arenysensis, Strain B593" /LENGTH=761 /DNA_ID=CAMNT_0003648299 /DNA_START=183 /DNA_END=2469 /DNA_ORIENTATION=+